MITSVIDLEYAWFYVRILLSGERTIGYMLKVASSRSAQSVSLVERKRLLDTDGGIGVWKISDTFLTEPQAWIYETMHYRRDITSADILFLKKGSA